MPNREQRWFKRSVQVGRQRDDTRFPKPKFTDSTPAEGANTKLALPRDLGVSQVRAHGCDRDKVVERTRQGKDQGA